VSNTQYNSVHHHTSIHITPPHPITMKLHQHIATLSIGLLLPILSPTIAPQIAQARTFEDATVPCFFFKGETLVLKEICQSNGASWMGGGGHSLKWNDGVVTKIKFGLHGRGTPVCPDKAQVSVDEKCGSTYSRSAKTLRRITSSGNEETILCTQLKGKSICWGTFSK
jgi:hypothetical protein